VETFDLGWLFDLFKVGNSVSYNSYAGYRFGKERKWFKNSKLRATVNNVFDREPTHSSSAFLFGIQPDLLAGRSFSLE